MNRIDLYNLVWSKPVTHVAKEFGLSDVAIHKLCKKHGIPTPPLGYWAKVKYGKKVSQTRLPPPKQGQSDVIDLSVYEKPTPPPEVLEAIQAAQPETQQIRDQVQVPDQRPANLHPIAIATEKALRKAKSDNEGFVTSSGPGRFDVKIAPTSIERAILIIHVLLNCAMDKGFQLSTEDGVHIVVDEQPLAVRFYETKSKAVHVPTSTDLKRQASEDDRRSKYEADYKSMGKVYPAWDYSPSGRLVLEISDPNQNRWRADPIVGRWRDRSVKRLENYIGDIISALKVGAAVARHQRAKEAEHARVAKEAEDKRREHAQQRRLLEKVTKFLAEKAHQHAELLKIETLAAYLSSNSDGRALEKDSDLERAIEFVLVNLRGQLTAQSISHEIAQTRLLEIEQWW